MKLGLLTAAFPSLSLAEVAAWSAENGFEALEIADDDGFLREWTGLHDGELSGTNVMRFYGGRVPLEPSV